MKSTLPKVLHPICGQPLLMHVIDSLSALPIEHIVVVVGHGADTVRSAMRHQHGSKPIEFVEQPVRKGTGDAGNLSTRFMYEFQPEASDTSPEKCP